MDPWTVKWADGAESRWVINHHFDDSSNTLNTEVTDKQMTSQRVIKVVSRCLSSFACLILLKYSKVNFSLEQATKAQRESRGVALLFL